MPTRNPRSRYLRFVLILFSLSLFLSPFFPRSYAESPLLMKMGTLAPEGSEWLKIWYEIVKEIEAHSPIPVKIITYPGGVMGDEPQLVRKLKLGQLHTIGVTVSGIGQLVPEILVLDLPFLFQSYEEIDAALKHFQGKFLEYARARGMEIMAILDQGIIRTFSKHPIPRPSDQLQRKIWGWSGEPVSLKNLEALGIVPVLLPVPEVLTGLQTGLIDTLHTSITALVALQWHTQVRYGYWNPLRYEPAAVLFYRKILERVPAGKRDEFMDYLRRTATPYIEKLQNHIRAQEKELKEALKESGVVITEWSKSDMQWWEEKTAPLYTAFVGQFYPQSLVDELRAFLKEYRSRQGAKK